MRCAGDGANRRQLRGPKRGWKPWRSTKTRARSRFARRPTRRERRGGTAGRRTRARRPRIREAKRREERKRATETPRATAGTRRPPVKRGTRRPQRTTTRPQRTTPDPLTRHAVGRFFAVPTQTQTRGPMPTTAKRERSERYSPVPVPRFARNTARPTRSSEPILLPKVRIHFADFPYLH